MPKPHKLADGRFECQNCLKKFTKNQYTYKDPLFCSDPCRKQFHATGGVSLKKIEDRVEKFAKNHTQQLQAAIDDLLARVATLESTTIRKRRA